MNALKGFFDRLAGGYDTVFAEWLDINFALRTLILLLLVWAAVFLFAQIFKYLIGPLLVLFYYHVIFRARNFLFTETLMELIYIRYFSRESRFLSDTYLRLCDKVKRNRMVLEHTKYKGILMSGGVARAARRLMIIGLVFFTLWVLAFGVYREFGRGADFDKAADILDVYSERSSNEGQRAGDPPEHAEPEPTPEALPAPLFFEGAAYLMLNEDGIGGSNLRDKPGVAESTVVYVVSGNAVLTYLGEYEADSVDSSLYWLKVLTESGVTAYISSKLVNVAG